MIQTFEYFHVRLDMYQQKLQTQNFNSIMNNLKEKKRAAFSCFFLSIKRQIIDMYLSRYNKKKMWVAVCQTDRRSHIFFPFLVRFCHDDDDKQKGKEKKTSDTVRLERHCVLLLFFKSVIKLVFRKKKFQTCSHANKQKNMVCSWGKFGLYYMIGNRLRL